MNQENFNRILFSVNVNLNFICRNLAKATRICATMYIMFFPKLFPFHDKRMDFVSWHID